MLFITKKKSGFTLIEVIIGTAIFVLLALSVYQAFLTTMDVVRLSRIKITATALGNEQLEIARNLKYQDVGIVGGLPVGKIPAIQNFIRDNKEFVVHTIIRNIDDPFDGTIGGEPNDTSPADYKLVEIEITCDTCRNFTPLRLTTHVAPKNLESASDNGAIFIKVFDSTGSPIPGALVHVENKKAIPTFVIEDSTNNNGILEIVDAPPGTEAYEIKVTKPGYTSEQTYTIGDPVNPNPVKPHATVLTQQLTQISFIIDEISTLNITSVDNICFAVPNVNFSLSGSKLIGTNPDIYKYDETIITDNSGEKIINTLDSDTYKLTFTDTTYDLIGAIPATSFTLNSGTIQNLKLILKPKDPKGLLVTVKDASTNLPLSNANVNLTGTNYNTTLITGVGFIRQTDWSSGAGQENYIDPARYFDSDGNIEINNPAGVIQLKKVLEQYEESAWLTSSTFDTGSTSTFNQILWQPQDQAVETGTDSVRLQIAINNDNNTWNFKGPDGTSGTYYTITSQEITPLNNEGRYLRYKIYLQTADVTKTPTVSDISFTFTSNCIPPGQVYFSGLEENSYNINISKINYQVHTETISTPDLWQQKEIILTP